MFKHITRIQNFGIFADFAGAGLPDFTPFNLIYGWNYSGKTTLSRVFRTIEKQSLHPDFPAAKFSLLDVAGRSLDERFQSDQPVRVYNDDFKNENLLWDEKEGFYPILLLGAENLEAWKELERLNDRQVELEAKIDGQKTAIKDDRRMISSAETTCAGRIAKELPVGRFDKRHLKPIIADWEGTLPEPLSANALQTMHAKLVAEEKELLEPFELDVSEIVEQWESAAKLLQEELVATQTIPHLLEHPDVANWVNEGRKIHEGKDRCEFCENALSNERRDELNSHFSEAFDLMKRRLSESRDSIEAIKIGDLNRAYPKSAFYKELHPVFDKVFDDFADAKNRFNDAAQSMVRALSAKIENPFAVIREPEGKSELSAMTAAVAPLCDLVAAHNARSKAFDEERNTAVEGLKEHFASEEMRRIDRFKLEERIKSAEEEKVGLEANLREVEIQSRLLKGRLSNAANGAQAINELLREFFGKDDIQIAVNSEERFVLMRNSEQAKNLSEGEKSAIAFCYFVTKLIEDGQELSELIVYIDDPMSSLDANHLLHLVAFIKNKFYVLDMDAPRPERHKCLAKQVFISTHSYEFFHLMFDWMKKMKKEMYSTWLLERCDDETEMKARLVECPDSIKAYRSEYLFLFHQLSDFLENPTDDARVIFNVGNMARRFIEGYSSFKFLEFSNIDRSLERLIDEPIAAERARKFMHLYSHTLSRGGGFRSPDMGEATDIVSAILSAVKQQDPVHYDALEATRH